jgi:hypothetical protein
MFERRRAPAWLALLAAASCQSPTGPSGGDDAGAPSAPVTLGFASATFTMYASIGGGPPHLVQLDTGSLGLYVPESVLGAAAQVSATETCSITYVSSGTTLSGHAATAAVALLGASQAGDVSPPPATVAMSLCAVDDPTFTGGVMGVGFGRTTPGDPARNVLLQIEDAVLGQVRAGYVLGTHPAPHVTLGLDAATAAGFQTLPLSPDPSGSGDWLASSLRGCLSLPEDPGFGTECGPLLVDTGIAESLLWGPSDPTLGGTIPSGQTSVPNGVAVAYTAGAALAYAFVVGQAPASPSYVGVRAASAFSINTGRALLVDDDYLFDAVAGAAGFRPAGP